MGAEPNNIIENIGGDWPPELFERVFRDLEDLTAATALTDIMKTMSALDGTQHSAAMSKLKGKFLIIDLIGAENSVELSHIARCASKIVCESNLIKTEYSKLIKVLGESRAIRKILVIDNDASISNIKESLRCCTDVILCCDSITSLQRGPVKDLISALAAVSMDTDEEPRHLILDFPKSSLTFWDNNNWLGIFDQKFVSDLCEYKGRISISIPAVDQITFHYGILDNILEKILGSIKSLEKCNCFDSSRGYRYCSKSRNPQTLYD